MRKLPVFDIGYKPLFVNDCEHSKKKQLLSSGLLFVEEVGLNCHILNSLDR
jgi:hypothetical protein